MHRNILKARPVMETTAQGFLELGRMQGLHTSSTPPSLYQQRFSQAIHTRFSTEIHEGYPMFPMNFLPLTVLNPLPNHWFPGLEGLTGDKTTILILFIFSVKMLVWYDDSRTNCNLWNLNWCANEQKLFALFFSNKREYPTHLAILRCFNKEITYGA